MLLALPDAFAQLTRDAAQQKLRSRRPVSQMSTFEDLSLPMERISQAERPYVPVSAEMTGHLFRWWFGLLLATCAFVGFLPNSDLAISRIVYNNGFQWENSWGIAAVQASISTLAVLFFFVAILGLILTLYGRTLFQVTPRLWAFVAGLYILAPGVLVNGILTNFWGRAHPTDITEFGGSDQFSPALRISDQCAQNCSFVSIEAALATAFAISLALLARMLPKGLLQTRILKAILWVTALAILLPVIDGSHFLSDTLFAGLFTAAIALAISQRLGLRDRLP